MIAAPPPTLFLIFINLLQLVRCKEASHHFILGWMPQKSPHHSSRLEASRCRLQSPVADGVAQRRQASIDPLSISGTSASTAAPTVRLHTIDDGMHSAVGKQTLRRRLRAEQIIGSLLDAPPRSKQPKATSAASDGIQPTGQCVCQTGPNLAALTT